MSTDKEKKIPTIDFPVKYEKTRKILEFVPYKIKEGESIIVRTKKNIGLSECCYVVSKKEGNIEIKKVKVDKE